MFMVIVSFMIRLFSEVVNDLSFRSFICIFVFIYNNLMEMILIYVNYNIKKCVIFQILFFNVFFYFVFYEKIDNFFYFKCLYFVSGCSGILCYCFKI